MGIFSAIGEFVSGIFSPAADLIDEVHTSDEERMKLRNALAEIEHETQQKMIEYETTVAELQAKLMETSSKVAIAESKSDSAFTRLYRPLIITGMFILFCLNSFGILTVALPDMFIQVFGAAFGVLTVGRSVEKIKRIGK